MRLTKIFIAIFAPDKRLPSSATLHDTYTYIYAGTNAYAHAGNVTFAGHQVHNHRQMQKHKQGVPKNRLISSQDLLMATPVTFATLTVNISGMTSEPQGLCSRRLSLEVTTHAGNTNACAALAEDAYYALVKVVLIYLGNNSG